MSELKPRRVLIGIEYEGTCYAGWQRQQNGPSVQAELETALSRAVHTNITVTGASRTDAGVHALGQRAHFDTDSTIPDDKWPFVFNTLLPEDIRVTSALRVPDDFHARFWALGKAYEYRILNRPFPSALRRNFTAFVPLPLDPSLMKGALPDLIGRHDFSAFEAAGGTAKTTVRQITEAKLIQDGDEIVLTVQGDAFLYNMVRIIAGTLISIGQKRLAPDAFRQAIQNRNRLLLGATAPARGLTLLRVMYGDRL